MTAFLEAEGAVAALDFAAEGDVGDIGERDRNALAHADHGALQIREGLYSALAAHDQFLRAALQEGTRHVDVGALQGLAHVLGAHTIGKHALGIEAHLILLDLAADGHDRGDAAKRQNARPDFPVGQRAQLHRRERVAGEANISPASPRPR